MISLHATTACDHTGVLLILQFLSNNSGQIPDCASELQIHGRAQCTDGLAYVAHDCHRLHACQSVLREEVRVVAAHLSRICIQDSVCNTKQEARIAWVHQKLDKALQQGQQASYISPSCTMQILLK